MRPSSEDKRAAWAVEGKIVSAHLNTKIFTKSDLYSNLSLLGAVSVNVFFITILRWAGGQRSITSSVDSEAK